MDLSRLICIDCGLCSRRNNDNSTFHMRRQGRSSDNDDIIEDNSNVVVNPKNEDNDIHRNNTSTTSRRNSADHSITLETLQEVEEEENINHSTKEEEEATRSTRFPFVRLQSPINTTTTTTTTTTNDGRSEGFFLPRRLSWEFVTESILRRNEKETNKETTTALTNGTSTDVVKGNDLLYERIHLWLNSLRFLDPRWQIKLFFDDSVQRRPTASMIEAHPLHPHDSGSSIFSHLLTEEEEAGRREKMERMDSGLSDRVMIQVFRRAKVFTVWRPTSLESIHKMMRGDAVGKGLGIKGKSAKRGLISGYVPFLQIHSNDEHKSKISTLPKNARICIYFRTESIRDDAILQLQPILQEMIQLFEQAVDTLCKDDCNDDAYELALQHMKLKMADPFINILNDEKNNNYGVDIPERLFWEAFVMRKDITRTPGSPMDTGRPSEPAFQDMNFTTTRKPKKYDPKAVVFQYGGHADNDPLCPLTLLMAYEENGRVCPVASDFDGFLMGTKSAELDGFPTLPPLQIEALDRTITQIGELLDDPSTRQHSWTTNWLNILKQNVIDGVKPNMPQYGYGDPKTYGIMENAISRLQSTGAVRHGSECFNYFFPQELDDHFLVISDNFQLSQKLPWKYLSLPEMQQFLLEQIDRGFTFPLNPKWILCDPGWGKVYDKLRASPDPDVQSSINTWLPPNTGLKEKIDAIRQRHPNGFKRDDRRQSMIDQSNQVSTSGFEYEGTHAMDLAKLQLKRYLVLQRAKRKLRIVLQWTNSNISKHKHDDTAAQTSSEDKRKTLLQLSLKDEQRLKSI